MATEAGILESISEKKVQDETGDLRCAQIHNPPEYTNKPLEVLKEHSNESEIEGGLTDSAALQSSQMIGQYPPYEAATATSESSILSESSKDQSSHSVTVGIIDSSEGEVFVEAPPRVQIHLEDICNGSNAGIHIENPINKEEEKLESGNMLRKDQKDELEEEKDVTIPKNSSSEANFTDASLHTAAVTNVALEEKMQRNDFGNDHPVKKSDEQILESTSANQYTEKADVLGEEKTSTEIHDNSVVKQYRDLENLEDKVDDKQLEKSFNLEHEKKDFEAIKDTEKSETQESMENLSVHPERLPLPEDLGETGLQKEDEENDRFDDLSGPPSEEQCDKDDRRVSMENYHEKEEIIGIISSNETSQGQNIASVEDKEEKLEESSFLASEEKILDSLDTTEKVSEIQYGKTSADAFVKELSNLKLSAEESALEDEMSSDKVKEVSFKEQEPIQRARAIIIEMETCKEETHTEMDPHKCTSQMKKEPQESNFIQDSMADKDGECISLVSTEKSPKTIYASKNIENEDLDERKQDGQMDASISTKTEVPGIQNNQVIITHKETYNVLYEEKSLQANDAMDDGDDLKKGENLNEQAKGSEEEKFEEAWRVVEVLDTRETVATAISMDEPHVVSAEDIIQDQETTHSRNEMENEVQEEEETNYGNIDASASSQLTDEIQSLNEEKEAQKFEEISKVVQDKDHCHETVLGQDDLKAQTTVYDMPEVSKTQNEEGIQEHEDKDGIDIDKIERVFEEKHVEAMAETKPSNHIKASEKGHAQEVVSVDIKEHADETINDGTLGPERIKDETDGAKLENDFIVVSREVEVTEGIANTEKENIDSKLPMNIKEIPKDDEVMCEKIEKAAAEFIHEYQTIMTANLSETGIPIEKSDNSEENVGDLPVAHNLEEETIQVCENMDHIKQELEPENVEKASKSASRHQTQMTIADTEATDLDGSRDGVSMDKTHSASSTIQTFILGNSQKATNPEEAEEKICEKINLNIGYDKYLGVSLEEEAQKDIHKKIDDSKRMEDIILGDEQIDETKAGLCSNEEQKEGTKLDKGDDPKQGKETYEDVVDREICLEENPIVDAPENVQEDDKRGNKFEKPSDEISVKIIMTQDSASNKEDVEEKGSPEEKEESSQEKGEVGVTLEQTVDRSNTEDPSHKPHGKDEKTCSIIGQNGDAEPARVKDEAQNDISVDISDTHELVGPYIDNLEGSNHEEVSNSGYEYQLDEYTDTKGNKVVDDREKVSQELEVISVCEDENREITCETEATKIENLNTDYNLNNMISETINMNGDNETSKSMDEEFREKNIKDTPDSHSLATQKIHDAAGEKHESETIIESEEQIRQTTSNKDNIDTDICKEKTDSDRLDFISESVPEEQSGESDAPKVDNLVDDDKLKIPAMSDLNDEYETAKVKYESILEKSMDTISDSHTSVLEKTNGRVDEKHKAPNSMSEEQIHQATNTEENKQIAVYNENVDIKRLKIAVKSGPEDQSPDNVTSKIEKTLDEDAINDMVNPLSNPQDLIEDTLQEEENPTVYAESTGVHKSTDHSISEEDKSSDSKSSVSSLDRSAERPISKEETNNDAILGSSLKHNVIENACELESEEKQDEVPEEKETSDTVLEESPSMVNDALERSVENLRGKQMIWEKEASENRASLSTECDVVEEGFQEDKEETKITDLGPEDQSPDNVTSKIEKTLDEDAINDTVNPLSNPQDLIEDTLQEEENPTVYAESTGVHKSTDHSISEEDKSSDSKPSVSSLDRSAERPISKEETNNDAILGSSLKHNVIENACELESEEKQDEVPEEKETSDTVLEESPSMVNDALERSVENLRGKQMIWEKEASENRASLSTECDVVEEGFQEDKEETKITDLPPECVYSYKSNETNKVNNSMKNGITNKEVVTSDDDQSHEASCSGKEYIIIKLQSEDNENANIKGEDSTNNGVNDTPDTSALGSEAASGSLHRGQRESITKEEETLRNMKSDQEAAPDLTSVEQNLEVIIKTDLANIDILEEDKSNLVAQYMASEVVNSKDEERISKTDDNLPTMPITAKEVRWEIEENHDKYPNHEEQIHERSITNNNMDNDTFEEDKNIEIERAPVRVSEEQSHEGTTRTGIIENEILEGALSASQNLDEEKTSKIAFLSEGNEHSCEAGEVCKRAICTLLKEAKSIAEAASGTSMQPEVGADELNEAHTSVFNRKFESLGPEKNQEEETPTRERASDACIGAPYNLVSVEPALAARAENIVDLTTEEWKAAKITDKEVKDSVLASHENSEIIAETKSTEIEPKDDALTVKKNSVEENMQTDAYWLGSEDRIHDSIEDHETTESVAMENRNKEEMEDRKMLQSKKMEDEKQEERKEIQAGVEISEAIYPSECNKESSEEKGTLNKGSEIETLEVVELEKPLNAFNIMKESEFTDRFVPKNEEPEVERSLHAKEMKDEKQEEENKIQSKEKICEADNTNKCNKESSEERRISERGAEKQKLDDVELENLLNVVPEGLEVAYQTENINSDVQEKEVTVGSLEAGFHKKEDKIFEDIVIELDVVNQSNEANHDSDATEGVLEQEKILKVVNFSATKEDQIKMVGGSSIKSDLVEEIKDVEPSGSHLQKESMEPKALETEEKLESISFEEEPEKNEKLGVGSQNDTNEVMQLEEASNMVIDRLPTAGLCEKTDMNITSEDVEAPDVAHVRDKPFHEQIQGDENKTEIKKPETKWELEETHTIVNEILNDKVKEPGYMPPKKNHEKMELSEKIDTTSPVDEEEPTKNVEFSSITTASSSEIMQDVHENLDKESVPKESTQIDAKTKVMGIEFANNMMNDEEGPIEIEKFEHISTNSVFVERTCNKTSMTSDANEKDEEAIDQEDREKLEEASNSVSNEKVDEWDDSLAAFIEDKDNSQNTPIKQATEVTTSAEEKEMIWQTEAETHEKVRDFGNSENEENQQTDQDDLPVSRFLMDRILQVEGDKLAEACDAKCEDKLQVNIHDQQNDVNISKQESNSFSLSVEQVKDDTSISEGKVEDLIEIEGSSDLVQQSHYLKKDTEYVILKDDESPDRNLHDTSLTLTGGEDVKDELLHLLDKELNDNISDNNMELVLAEEHSPESKVDVDDLKKLENIIPIPAPEMMSESIIQKDDESLKKNSDVATVIKAFEEDTLKKEGGKESQEISLDIAGNDKASYATSEEQTPSVAEPVGNAKGEIQVKETVSNIQGDQPGKFFPSSSIEDSTIGEALETQSGGIKFETRKENQDGTAESQMKDVKNNLSEELKVSDSHKVQQSAPIVEPTNETVQGGERFLAERSPTVSADEKKAKEIAGAHMKQEKTDEEKDEKEVEDENKTEKSGHNAAVVVEAKDADVKPAHKKSHNILSGVGSKVKHSIAKVKKAITGKSSHSKTLS